MMDKKEEKIGKLKAQSKDSRNNTLGDSEGDERENEKNDIIKGIMWECLL